MRSLAEQHVGSPAPLWGSVFLLAGGAGLISQQRPSGGGGGSGATTLHDLTDVDDTGKADTNVLAYESASGKWKPAGAGTPAAHASSHQSGGADAIKLDELAAPDDNTDLDVSTAKHGLTPKLPGGTSSFLRADGTWATPAAGSAALDDLTDVAAPSPGVGEVLTWDGSDWVPDTASATVATLDAVGDVNAPSPSDGDVLTWDSGAGEWVAAAPGVGGGGLTGVKWAEIDFNDGSSPAEIVALVSSKKIRVHQIAFTVSADCAVAFRSNTTAIIEPMSFPGQGGLNVDRGAEGWFMETASGEAFRMAVSAVASPCYVRGSICYTEV